MCLSPTSGSRRSRSFLVKLFLRVAGVSYGRFMACVVS